MKARRVVRLDRLGFGLLSVVYATMTARWNNDPWAGVGAAIFYAIGLYFLITFALRTRWIWRNARHAQDCACADCAIRSRTEVWARSTAGREWLSWRVRLRLFNEAIELMQAVGALHGCWVVGLGAYARVRNPKNGAGFDIDLHSGLLLRRLRETGPAPSDIRVISEQQLGPSNGRACLQSALDWMLEAKAGE